MGFSDGIIESLLDKPQTVMVPFNYLLTVAFL